MTTHFDITTLTAPTWAELDGRGDHLHLADGALIFTWERIVSPAVWLSREDRVTDGRVTPGVTTVNVDAGHAVFELDAEAARLLAAELLEAAALAAVSHALEA